MKEGIHKTKKSVLIDSQLLIERRPIVGPLFEYRIDRRRCGFRCGHRVVKRNGEQELLSELVGGDRYVFIGHLVRQRFGVAWEKKMHHSLCIS